MNRPLSSALKSHCKPGPRSPSRCNSSLNAAIPPTFLPFDNAVAFHKALKPRELANPQFRAAVGELAAALFTKNTANGLRSIATLENLCGLSQNESAVSCLRELAKSFGRNELSESSLPVSISRLSGGSGNASKRNALSPATYTDAAECATTSKSSLHASHAQLSTESSPPGKSRKSLAQNDDSVRFSASVQSKLYDTTESPSAVSGSHGASGKRTGNRRTGDKSGQGPSGSSSRKKSRVLKGGMFRSSSHSTKHLSDRAGNVSSVPVETPRSKNNSTSAVPSVVQLQSNPQNVAKVQRKSKKSTGASKRTS